MAATGSVTESFAVGGNTQVSGPPRGHYQYILAWTSDSSGSVSYTGTRSVNGILVRIVTIPDAVAPTDNYDINSIQVNGIDISDGLLANRDTANTEEVIPLVQGTDGTNTGMVFRSVAGVAVLDIANAGNAKKGQIILHFKN